MTNEDLQSALELLDKVTVTGHDAINKFIRVRQAIVNRLNASVNANTELMQQAVTAPKGE